MLNEFTFKEFRNKKTRIMVTPEMAKELLGHNNNNRNLSESSAREYARDMKRGQWKNFVPDGPIVISKSGRLLNGQHRLYAIILSGITVGLFFVWDEEDEMFFYLDNGKKRTASDFVQGKFTNERATLARAVLLAEHGSMFKIMLRAGGATSDMFAPSRREISDRANCDDFIYESCGRAKRLSGLLSGYKIISASTLSSFFYLVFKKEDIWDSVDKFASLVADEFTTNISVRALQNSLTKLSVQRFESKPQQSYVLGLFLKAYSNYKNNSTAKKLTVKQVQKYLEEYEKMLKELFDGGKK